MRVRRKLSIKVCSNCKQSKNIGDFHAPNHGKCKVCFNEHHRAKWHNSTPEQKALKKEKSRTWFEAHPKHSIVMHAKQHAKRKNVPFSITVDDINVPDICPFMGIKIEKGPGKIHAGSPSIDEIVPGLGYVPGNIQIISSKANSMKHNATREELLTFARAIIEKYDLGDNEHTTGSGGQFGPSVCN